MEDASWTAIVPATSTGGGVAAFGVHPNINARAKSPITIEYNKRGFIFFFSNLTKGTEFYPTLKFSKIRH
jgi:hypothetical protein